MYTDVSQKHIAKFTLKTDRLQGAPEKKPMGVYGPMGFDQLSYSTTEVVQHGL